MLLLKKQIWSKKITISLTFIILITMLALIVPLISKYSYYSQDLNIINQLPNMNHWFGTDKLGRDIFTRIFYGARISLTVAYTTSIINLLAGVVYGSIAGYVGGSIDNLMMRIVDTIYSIPSLLYTILLTVILGPGLSSIIIAISISSWINTARIVRGQVMSLKQEEFVLAAKEFASPLLVIFNIIIPNCIGTMLVSLVFSIPGAIFTEAFLSFIGLGIPAPQASWGTLISDALNSYQIYPTQLLFPALAICLTILAFNLLGDDLQYRLSK